MESAFSTEAQRAALTDFFATRPTTEIELDNTPAGRFDAARNTPRRGWDLQAAFLQPAGIFCFVTDPQGNQPDEMVILWAEATEEAIEQAYDALIAAQAWQPGNADAPYSPIYLN
jgi:hypothetical protein